VGVSAIVLFALTAMEKCQHGSKVQNFTTVLKGLVFFVMVIACFTMGRAAHRKFLRRPLSPSPLEPRSSRRCCSACRPRIYTYDGWDGVIYFGDEVKNPAI